SHYFENFAKTFVASPRVEEADYMVAFANYKQSPNYRLDQTPTEDAINKFQLFMNKYPTSSRVPQCNAYIDELRKKLEAKAFHQGELYYNLRQFDAATRTFENLLKAFPDTDDAEEVRFLILKSSFLLAQNSIYEKKEERFLQTLDNYENFKNKHPKSKHNKEAKNILATSRKRLKEF
ncbi:MAG: outer membrane protein assembly factor BamD, partial [Bacteroidota bacterium]